MPQMCHIPAICVGVLVTHVLILWAVQVAQISINQGLMYTVGRWLAEIIGKQLSSDNLRSNSDIRLHIVSNV